jgi:hypothetical protein
VPLHNGSRPPNLTTGRAKVPQEPNDLGRHTFERHPGPPCTGYPLGRAAPQREQTTEAYSTCPAKVPQEPNDLGRQEECSQVVTQAGKYLSPPYRENLRTQMPTLNLPPGPVEYDIRTRCLATTPGLGIEKEGGKPPARSLDFGFPVRLIGRQRGKEGEGEKGEGREGKGRRGGGSDGQMDVTERLCFF